MTAEIIPFKPRPRVISRSFDDVYGVTIGSIRSVVRATYQDYPPVAVAAGEEVAVQAFKDGKTYMQAMSLAGDKVRDVMGKCLSNVMKGKK